LLGRIELAPDLVDGRCHAPTLPRPCRGDARAAPGKVQGPQTQEGTVDPGLGPCSGQGTARGSPPRSMPCWTRHGPAGCGDCLVLAGRRTTGGSPRSPGSGPSVR
jgi:hypothetical protein